MTTNVFKKSVHTLTFYIAVIKYNAIHCNIVHVLIKYNENSEVQVLAKHMGTDVNNDNLPILPANAQIKM